MKIGCLGFGEVGSTFATALADSGADVRCFDPKHTDQKPAHPNIAFKDFAEVLTGADIVLSMVTTDLAKQVAGQTVGHLKAKQIYVDFNSTSPKVKKEIDGIFAKSDAIFVEGAVLGLIAATGAKTRILLGGSEAASTADILNDFGLNCEPYREEIGAASSFKMLRSIFSKGIEAVLIEALVAAERDGIRDDIWAEICGTFEKVPFEKMASSWITSHAVACKRRRDEMIQVEGVVRDLGLAPVMSAAATKVLEHSTRLGLNEAFQAAPKDMNEVIAWLDKNND